MPDFEQIQEYMEAQLAPARKQIQDATHDGLTDALASIRAQWKRCFQAEQAALFVEQLGSLGVSYAYSEEHVLTWHSVSAAGPTFDLALAKFVRLVLMEADQP